MTDEPTGHKLGEVLRAAREARGVDLARVERETKIRARYLTALETGDYRDLPGAVYTKGFLRNYGAYLGLDAEYLIDLYRLESSSTLSERVSVQPPPRPITARARAGLRADPRSGGGRHPDGPGGRLRRLTSSASSSPSPARPRCESSIRRVTCLRIAGRPTCARA